MIQVSIISYFDIMHKMDTMWYFTTCQFLHGVEVPPTSKVIKRTFI